MDDRYQRDVRMMVTQMTNLTNMGDVDNAILVLYMPDLSIDRGAICEARKITEQRIARKDTP